MRRKSTSADDRSPGQMLCTSSGTPHGKKTVPAKTKEEQPARLPRKVYEKELLRLQASW